MAFKFRNSFYKLVPQWLTTGEGELVLWTLNRIVDAFDDMVRAAVEARFPTRAGANALALIGRDRGIPRGRSETAAHYAARLKRWRWPRGHRTRGSAYALLEQVSEYWGGMTVATFDVNQSEHVRDAQGNEAYAYDQDWDWDADPDPLNWARFWLVLVPGNDVPSIIAWPALLGTWGGSLAPGRGLTLGQQGVTPGDIRAMRRFFHGTVQWKPAGTRTDYAVLDLDGAAVVPGGLWGTVRGRVTNARNTLRFWRVGTVVIP